MCAGWVRSMLDDVVWVSVRGMPSTFVLRAFEQLPAFRKLASRGLAFT